MDDGSYELPLSRTAPARCVPLGLGGGSWKTSTRSRQPRATDLQASHRTSRPLNLSGGREGKNQASFLHLLCLVPKKKHYAEKRFSVTLNLRYMHGVLNVDEIKN
jgi:hypothetical protein